MSGHRPRGRCTRAGGRLRGLLIALKDSFWFVPSVGLLAAVLLGVALVQVEEFVDAELAEHWPRLFGSGAEGARGMLSAIASSMITVAGVVFSLTVVALSLTASAYSPRVLRTFLHDRATQIAFAVFVGVFVYCLVVLRAVRAQAEGGFVPSIAVVAALVLALVGVWVLVYFIHHLAVSIQVSTILERIAVETRSAIESMYPDSLDADEDEAELEPAPELGTRWRIVPARRTGYIVAADTEALLALACRRGSDMRMELVVGDFAIEGLPLAALARDGDDEDDARTIDAAHAIADERSIEQDPAFGIQQILDVAVRALSPGINSTGTAALCIDHLSAIFVALAPRRMPLVVRSDAGDARLIIKGPTFDTLADAAFAPLARNAAGNVQTLAHLARALRRILAVTPPQRRTSIQRYLGAIESGRRAAA